MMKFLKSIVLAAALGLVATTFGCAEAAKDVEQAFDCVKICDHLNKCGGPQYNDISKCNEACKKDSNKKISQTCSDAIGTDWGKCEKAEAIAACTPVGAAILVTQK